TGRARVPRFAARVRARLRAGRLPRLLDLVARRGRDNAAAAGEHVASRRLRRTLHVRQAVLVPLLPRAAGAAAGQDGSRLAPLVWRAQRECEAGARQMNAALVTFS